jgi:hypothetical protein
MCNERQTFEEFTEGFDQLESHVLEQATDVMVRLDGRARALEADALDHVRVERSLEQPLDLALVRLRRLELGGLLLEHVDERVPDDLALLFRVLDALQAGEEEIGRVDDGQVHAQVLVEHDVHLRRLVATEHAVVDHDGMESNGGNCLRKKPMLSCSSHPP